MQGEGSLGSPDTRPCFYKVMSPANYKLDELLIPSDFKEHIILRKEESDGMIVSGGGKWYVELIKDEEEGDIYIRNGWQEFAKHHSLGNLEFLLFHYNGDLSFDVTIFNKDGTEKTYQPN
ncbi:hypothetical protein ACS0TY_002550 [Phlomoides rotata]